jgi:hypothetical protein
MKWEYVDVEEIKKETPAAFLMVIDGEEHWIPKSQMSDPDDYNEGDVNLTDVAISAWIAGEKDIETK